MLMTTGDFDFEARSKEVGIDRAAWELLEHQTEAGKNRDEEDGK